MIRHRSSTRELCIPLSTFAQMEWVIVNGQLRMKVSES